MEFGMDDENDPKTKLCNPELHDSPTSRMQQTKGTVQHFGKLASSCQELDQKIDNNLLNMKPQAAAVFPKVSDPSF